MAAPKNVTVRLKLPLIGEIEGTWEPVENERMAAWELYVELITRISVAELKPCEGSLREALSSLHSLFKTIRRILRKYGPSVAQSKSGGKITLGFLSIAILNTVLRPLLSKWHPMLTSYENMKRDSVSSIDHERNWDKYEELIIALKDVRIMLIEYANLLAEVAQVPSLIIERE
jgi:hypothetical protein